MVSIVDFYKNELLLACSKKEQIPMELLVEFSEILKYSLLLEATGNQQIKLFSLIQFQREFQGFLTHLCYKTEYDVSVFFTQLLQRKVSLPVDPYTGVKGPSKKLEMNTSNGLVTFIIGPYSSYIEFK